MNPKHCSSFFQKRRTLQQFKQQQDQKEKDCLHQRTITRTRKRIPRQKIPKPNREISDSVSFKTQRSPGWFSVLSNRALRCIEIAVKNSFFCFQVKIWFQNRRAKWKRVKAGLTSSSGSRTTGGHSGTGTKIVVPIPVHVNRFAVRSQHQQLEKCGPGLLHLGGLTSRTLGSSSSGFSVANQR